MTATKPFGNLNTATILVIGHDPRLQRGRAEAEYAFFLDYLLRPRPGRAAEARKYDLARALQNYVSDLAGREIALASLYVTNLCNEFLPPTGGNGTVLIPDEQAAKGLKDICQTISRGHFQIILPLSLQVCYHLSSQGFFDHPDERVQNFIQQARQTPAKASRGVYTPIGNAAFLEMCGYRFCHHGIPVVPVLHVKQWPLRLQMRRYDEPMQKAAQEIRCVLAEGGTLER